MNILSHDMSMKIANLHESCINNPTSAVFLGLMLIIHTLNPGMFLFFSANILEYICHRTVHNRFRGSVNCGAPSMENSFKVANFLF